MTDWARRRVTWSEAAAWHLSGHRMIERFTLTGQKVSMPMTEPLLGMLSIMWGFALVHGGSHTADVAAVLNIPHAGLGWGLMIVCGVQVLGATLAWLGLVHPYRTPRLALLLCAVWWWATLTIAVTLAGFWVGGTVYLVLTIISLRDYRTVWLNGHGS